MRDGIFVTAQSRRAFGNGKLLVTLSCIVGDQLLQDRQLRLYQMRFPTSTVGQALFQQRTNTQLCACRNHRR
ncbi:hypothetical protein ASF66_17250 [Pseudomonas sp. Leaf129]|uniref:hypothetical protein n=1 Tax=Pseudomonas sp. Leaf129 TaxID=1736268 RepID=UPI000702E98F|nr:hypothetical protein [Pseudomonas sp. Leaf129]KQQ57860.1 hypothetical protein ASF66_17250 [Pseudomonas sp. Leaf129]